MDQDMISEEAAVASGTAERVSRSVWQWRQPVAVRPPAAADIRRRAMFQSLIGLCVGNFLVYAFHRPVAGLVVCTIAVLLLVMGVAARSAFLAVERFALRFGRLVGGAMTWLLLVPFFYLCFVPARIVQLWAGNDPMNRKIPTPNPTYWVARPPVTGPESYNKQF